MGTQRTDRGPLGRVIEAIAVGLVLGISAPVLAVAATSTSSAGPVAVGSKAIPDCRSSDVVGDPKPQWRATYAFRTPNGKHKIDAVQPGGLARFTARVTGGNVKIFNMEVSIYRTPKALEVLKRGSHPRWYKGGGNPTWPLKDLCHWKAKRNISFLIRVSNHARRGKKLCLPFDAWAKATNSSTYYPTGNAAILRRCLRVK